MTEEELKELERHRKKTKLTLLGLIIFLLYMTTVCLVAVVLALMGKTSPWVELSLYVGNVVALGLSFYIMRNAKKIKLPILFWVGVFVLIINGWQVIKFFM